MHTSWANTPVFKMKCNSECKLRGLANLQSAIQARTDHFITWQEPPNCTRPPYTKLYQPVIVCKAERHNLESLLVQNEQPRQGICTARHKSRP